jgi:3-hydroxyisobutyrate dehydrogenase-like beta-hydroxyacid dehydrogenase
MSTIGMIGLGNAGGAVASALARHFEVVGFDADPARRAPAQASGVRWAADAAEVAASGECVLLSLPHPDVSRQVVDAVCSAPATPRLLIETSTITPGVARALGARCAQAGIGFVDAAIAGGVQAMAAGRNTFLVGGAPEHVAHARTVLDRIAERVFELGPVGAGSGAKVVNNAVMHALMVVLIEAAAMARKLDIAMPTLIEVLSRADGVMRPLEHRVAERMVAGDYAGGMSVHNARKDSVLALATAQDLGVPLFAILAAHTPYEIAEQTGMGELDYAALARLWEQWCQVRFDAPSVATDAP